MNTIQRLLIGFMLLVIGGFVLYPSWSIGWTTQVDYVYYYDKDLSEPRPPAGLFERGSERVRHMETRRAFLFPGPARPMAAIPPPTTERTGTGTLDLGERHTLYTDARVLGFTARVNRLDTFRDVVLLLIPLGLFLFMFRNKRQV